MGQRPPPPPPPTTGAAPLGRPLQPPYDDWHESRLDERGGDFGNHVVQRLWEGKGEGALECGGDP